MSKFPLIVAAALIVVTLGAGGWWLFSDQSEAEFPSNSVFVNLCNCDGQPQNLSAAEWQALLEQYFKQDISGQVDYLVPFLNASELSGQAFAIPMYGMSWIAQKFAPATYRREYREEDQKKWLNGGGLKSQEFLDFKNVAFQDCYDVALRSKVAFTYDWVESSSSGDAQNGFQTAIDQFHQDIESGRIGPNDEVLIRIDCIPGQIVGCMDSEACNFNPAATVDAGCNPKDACGECDGPNSGPGAVYDCGCKEKPPGNCDCMGNKLDALGVCGGECRYDIDGDGICDPPDRDRDGVPDSRDACPTKDAGTSAGNGCLMRITHDNDAANFIIEGTKKGQHIEYEIKTPNGKVCRGKCTSHSLFPLDSKEANGLLNCTGKDAGGATDLELKVSILDKKGKVVFKESFMELDLICLSNGHCGLYKQGPLFEPNSTPPPVTKSGGK